MPRIHIFSAKCSINRKKVDFEWKPQKQKTKIEKKWNDMKRKVREQTAA